MKNAISYYYNMNPTDIHQTGKIFKFVHDNNFYLLMPCERIDEINTIYELSYELNRRGVPIHQIILNSSNQIITLISDISYVLMKVLVSDRKLTLNDILSFNNLVIDIKDNYPLRRDNWFKLWCEKIDYFEYQVNQMGKKYPLIRESFSYYVGLAENGICLFRDCYKSGKIFISHRRIFYNESILELYNPLNLVIDLQVRDVCEYFKSCFFNGVDVFENVKQYLYLNNFDNENKILFLSRMLFPSYYFDLYEKIIAGDVLEEEIKKITKRVDDYELFLRKIYFLLKDEKFPFIDWLNKN